MPTPSLSVFYPSRFGTLRIDSDGEALTGLQLYTSQHKKNTNTEVPCLQQACRQLQSYFDGDLQTFDLPLALHTGTKFQQQVWQELCRIPFGTTISYSQLAERIGRPRAFRAVGTANGRNPLAIIVPCHRVIGSDGSLAGYAGGLKMKEKLLRHETLAISKISYST